MIAERMILLRVENLKQGSRGITTEISADFVNFIKDETQATAGNLSIQIKKLQDAGYIEVKKTFLNNYPNTSLSITKKGIEAFETYVNNLKNYINPK